METHYFLCLLKQLKLQIISTWNSHKIQSLLSSEKCKAWLFRHAFSGCDMILYQLRWGKTLFGQLAEWHLILRPQHYALRIDTLQMKVLSQQFNCLSYILMIIQTLLRKWMKQASSSLLEKEEQWRHLFHLLKQHYKMKELSAGHVWGQMLSSAPNLPFSYTDLIKLYKH